MRAEVITYYKALPTHWIRQNGLVLLWCAKYGRGLKAGGQWKNTGAGKA